MTRTSGTTDPDETPFRLLARSGSVPRPYALALAYRWDDSSPTRGAEPSTGLHPLFASVALPVSGRWDPPRWTAVMTFVDIDGALNLCESTLTYVHFDERWVSDDRLGEAADPYSMMAWLDGRLRRCPPEIRVPAGGISIRHMRGYRFGNLQREARTLCAEVIQSGLARTFLPSDWGVEATRRPGPNGKEDSHYAQLAVAYETLWLKGDDKLVATLADQYHLAVNTVRNQLSEARRRGLLETRGRGIPGGRATPKAHQVLDRLSNEDSQ